MDKTLLQELDVIDKKRTGLRTVVFTVVANQEGGFGVALCYVW